MKVIHWVVLVLIIGGLVLSVQYVAYRQPAYTPAVVVPAEDVSEASTTMAVLPTVATATTAIDTSEEDQRCVLFEDFSTDTSWHWGTVNDGVMGGLSSGVTRIGNGVLTHSGELVTRGGGFSYTGTRFPAGTFTGYSELTVRLNTNDRFYAINLNDARYRSVSHRIPLPVSDGWQEVTVAFADAVPTSFGRRVNAEPFTADEINELNFILSDGIDGPFAMELAWIRLCE